MIQRSFYVLYKDKAEINYIYLLKLYKQAKSYDKQNIKNKIVYTTINELAEKVNIKYNTLTRILKDKSYNDYFTVQNKTIIIHNNFKSMKNIQFVVLMEEEVNFLIDQNNNLLAKYFIYHKFYCGFNKSKKHNSTAKQILECMGYSNKSNNYISLFSEFNQLLVQNKLINIEYYIENGKQRIFYYFD